ncbi:MAG TPA: hypothetical protein VMT45_03245, partial [Thermoanaerobaculaceae bacterium]|nr:hypothetical protein [Thermoanaerobaculaceae bacterium]
MRFTGPAVAILALGASGAALLGCSGGGHAIPPNQVPITAASRRAVKEYLKGRDLEEKLRATDAREHYAAALAFDPSFALAYVGIANTAPTTVDFFDALRHATALVGQVSEGEAHIIRALEAGVNGQPQAQLQHLTALVQAYPDDERAHNLLALFYFGRQEWPR